MRIMSKLVRRGPTPYIISFTIYASNFHTICFLIRALCFSRHDCRFAHKLKIPVRGIYSLRNQFAHKVKSDSLIKLKYPLLFAHVMRFPEGPALRHKLSARYWKHKLSVAANLC